MRRARRAGRAKLAYLDRDAEQPVVDGDESPATSEIVHDATPRLRLSTVATPVFTRPIAHGVTSSCIPLPNTLMAIPTSSPARWRGAQWTNSGSAFARCGYRWVCRAVLGLAVDARHAHARGARTRTGRVRRRILASRLVGPPALSAPFIPALQTIPGMTLPHGR